MSVGDARVREYELVGADLGTASELYAELLDVVDGRVEALFGTELLRPLLVLVLHVLTDELERLVRRHRQWICSAHKYRII